MVISSLVSDHTLSSVTTSAVVVYLIQYLKRAKWFPLLEQRGTAVAARIASVIGSIFSTAGLQWQWMPETHTFLISNLTLSVVVYGIWHCIEHFALQEWIYQSASNKPPAPDPPEQTREGP